MVQHLTNFHLAPLTLAALTQVIDSGQNFSMYFRVEQRFHFEIILIRNLHKLIPYI